MRNCSALSLEPTTAPTCAPRTPCGNERHGQNDVDGLRGRGMEKRGEGGHEDDLKERRADHNLRGHAQKVDHRGHHDEAAAHAHDRRQNAHRCTNEKGRNGRDIEPRGAEAHLEGQAVHPDMAVPLLALAAGFRAAHRVDAFDEHQPADDPEEDHVGEAHEQIDLTLLLQEIEHPDAEARAHEPACEQDHAHAQIDRAAFEMRHNARDRGGDDLVGAGGHRHGGGMPMKNKSGVIRKPPPTPNIPDSMPTSVPSPKRRIRLTETSAMGR